MLTSKRYHNGQAMQLAEACCKTGHGPVLQSRPGGRLRSRSSALRGSVDPRLFRHVFFFGPAQLAGGCGVDHGLNLVDGVRWEAAEMCVLADQSLIARDVNAVNFIGGDEALHPLD